MMAETRESENCDAVKSADDARARRRRMQTLVALLCLGLSTVAAVPFFFMGQSGPGAGAFEMRMPTTHDMFLHFDQMRSFYNGLDAGEVYPRWEEDTNRGFGAPTTSYYPPGIYYLTAACYALARDWLRALLGAHLVMMIASAAALYIYARETMGRAAATAAMATYIFLPYHLADQYQRGAMAELLGFIWMPMMLQLADRLLKAPCAEDPSRAATSGSSLLSVVGLALSYGAFVWSHPPTAFQFTLGFGVYVLVLSLVGRQWKGLAVIVVAGALGLGLSAVYLGPAAIEQNLIHKEFIFETWPYHKTYIFVHDLYSADFYGGFFKLLDWIWITGTIVIAGAALVLLWFKRQMLADLPALHRRVPAWVIVGGLASFMMTKASMPVGKLIPKIDIGVFTWRMLSITTLVVALLTGAFVESAIAARREGRRRSERLLFASLSLVVLVGSVAFSGIAVMRPVASYSTFEPEQEHINYATIPITAPADPEELPVDTPRAELAEENGRVSVEEWKPEHRVVKAELTNDDQLLLRTFNFPGWTATVDGRVVPIRTAEELGDMEIDLVAGSHTVELDFLDTPVRRYGRVTTLLSLGLVFVLGGAGFARRFKRGRVSAFS